MLEALGAEVLAASAQPEMYALEVETLNKAGGREEGVEESSEELGSGGLNGAVTMRETERRENSKKRS